jgi:hypothetical protein
MDERAAPGWLLLFAGCLVASTQLGPDARGAAAHSDACRLDERWSLPRGAHAARAPGALEIDRGPAAGWIDVDRLSPRELRGLPGVGETRALAIARARWEDGLRGGPEAYDSIPGIGPETVRAIREWIDAAGRGLSR